MSTGIGDALKHARQQQGRTIADAAEATRVRSDFLRALEDERFAAITVGAAYGRHFLRAYARYLALDPEPLVDAYRREVADDEPGSRLAAAPIASRATRGATRAARGAWLAWAIVVAAAVAAVIAADGLFGGRAPAPAAAPTVAAPEVTPAEPSATAAPQVTASAVPSATPVRPLDGVNLLLAFEEDCWVRVEVDGEEIEQGVVPRGQTRTYRAGDAVTIRFGNPGGVTMELNGDNLGPAGQRGEPNTVLFTADGFEVVA